MGVSNGFDIKIVVKLNFFKFWGPYRIYQSINHTMAYSALYEWKSPTPFQFFLHIFLFTTGVDTKYELYRGINVHKSIKSRPLNFLCRCGGQELLSLALS